MKNIRYVIIIGSGPAGLTAAIYNSRANLKPLVFSGNSCGGQLMITTEVENFPGFPDGVMGPTLMQNMIKQATKFGAELLYKRVTKVDFSGDVKKVYIGNDEYLSKAVIIATGSAPRKLGLESEDTFWGKGVSACATCDGAFYKDKIVAVIGGGDSAMEEANFLTRFASKVYLIHRKESFKASKAMQKKVFDNSKIEIIFNSQVVEILGDKSVNKVKISNVNNGEEKEIKLDGIFIAIGHIPSTDFLKGAVDLDEKGYVKVIDGTRTSKDGVFVAGDVKDYRYQQAITAAGMGCMAALDVEKWLLERNN